MVQSEIDQIRKKYPRRFTFKYRGKVIQTGEAVDVLLIPDGSEYLKGVEKLHYDNGKEQFRFMYWVKAGKKKWSWGQFNVCMNKGATKKLLEKMKTKGWL